LSEDNEHEETDVARQNVIDLVESFIEQIQQIRKTLLSVSISAVVLAPLAIGSYYIAGYDYYRLFTVANNRN
jgi:hypothetical protein